MLIPPNVLDVVKRSRNMCAMTGLNILSLALWREGVRRTGEGVVGYQSNVQHEIDCHPELVSGSHKILKHRGKSDVHKILKQVQHDSNSLKRTYSQNMIKPLTLTLSPCGSGKSPSRSTFHTSLKKRAAFTLAEVLITLGIIGVVAAITMPSVIGHYKRQETAAHNG